MPKPYFRFSNLPSNIRKGKAEVKSTEPQTSKNGTGKEKKLKPAESLKPADGGETTSRQGILNCNVGYIERI